MKIAATSNQAQQAMHMLSKLQSDFMTRLQSISEQFDSCAQFKSIEWLRDAGLHGGGVRFEAVEGSIFNRASINISQVQYDDLPDKSFSSATALSTIIHPLHPLAPSIHIHISWTELKNGQGYWRLMADLNPSIPDHKDKAQFDLCLKEVTGKYHQQGERAGDTYFYIPALQTSRGVSHFYLEGFNPDSMTSGDFAKDFGESVIQCYCSILAQKLRNAEPPTAAQKAAQINYHTLYFYQVLTLDKGTTAGLLIHNQNDTGTLGSLPARINRVLLASWVDITPAPQDELIKRFLKLLPEQDICLITTPLKTQIAEQIRAHYKVFPINNRNQVK
ncbi:MAG: coproporphyrinogen III oxidase [Psychromonas sp.]|jgi:coproporphyrinogen III oxidase|uniref:coproporphyrinogen III oxidase n=1 Tax=Psychromonas sp. TaxID=1884585 RepID=UPI0039E70553